MSGDSDKAGGGDENHPDNKKLSGENWTSLREKKRGCTDCLCVLLFIAAMFGMTILGFIVTGVIESDKLDKGDPMLLTNGIDYDGRICGATSGVKSRSNAFYMPTGAAVCVKRCPSDTDYTQFICYDDNQASADNDTATAWSLVGDGKCMYHVKTKSYLNRCIWVEDKSPPAQNVTQVAGAYVDLSSIAIPTSYTDPDDDNVFTRFFADVFEQQEIIFGFGIGLTLFLAFLYLYFLRIPGVLFTMIWSILIGILVLLFVGSVMLWSLSTDWEDSDDRTKNEWMSMRVFAIIGIVLTVLYLCFLCVMRSRIMLALGIIKEAARALAAMPVLVFMPIIQSLGIVIFLVPWTIYCLYLASSGNVEVESETVNGNEVQYKVITYNMNIRYAFLYLLFCWFWASQLIVAFGELVSALSISCWYFTRDKKSEGNTTVIWSFKTALFKHFGTVAYGSLVIAIIKTIRAVIAYLQKKAKKSGNKLLQYILCMIQCCMWCLEKCMKFLNKNAYIQTAIHGYSFCKAARSAFFLIARNILRIMAVSFVGDFVLILGKVFVPLVTLFLAYLVLAYSESDNLANLIPTLIFTGILSYFVTSMFVGVFGMAISTILVCYISDEEMFPPEDRFCDGPLKGAIKKSQQAASDTQVVPEEATEIKNDEPKENEEVLL